MSTSFQFQAEDELSPKIDRINKSAKKLQDTFGRVGKGGKGLSKDMEAAAQDIEKTTDGFDKLRSAVDATGDTLRLFGPRARKIADAIEDGIEDPAERAERAVRALQRQMGKTTLIDRGNRAIGRGRAELEIFRARMGSVGTIAGVTFGAIALGAGTAAGVIANELNKSLDETKRRSEEVNAAFISQENALSDYRNTVGEFAFNALEMDNALDSISAGLGTLRDGIRSNKIEFAGFNLELDKTVKGLRDAAIASATFGASNVLSKDDAVSLVAKFSGKLPFRERERLRRQEQAAAARRAGLQQAIGVQNRSGGSVVTDSRPLTSREEARQAIALQIQRNEAIEKVKAEEERKRRKAAAAARKREQERRRAASAVDSGGSILSRALERGRGASNKFARQQTLFRQDQEARSAREAQEAINKDILGGKGLEKELEQHEKIKREIESARDAKLEMNAQMARGAEIAQTTGTAISGAFAQAVGSIVAGQSAASSLSDSFKNVVAEQAAGFGQYLILQGAGLLFTPGQQLQGAGSIAAGVALQAFGSGFGASGSSSSSSSSGGGASAVTSSISRFRSPFEDTTNQEPRMTILRVGDRDMRAWAEEERRDAARRNRG